MKITNNIVIEKAKEVGFDLVGFTKADKLREELRNLEDWLSRRFQGGMKYMERNLDKREDVSKILPDAKSVISVALNYYTDLKHSNKDGKGKISRYAWGKDYHLIIWKMLEELEHELKHFDPEFKCKSYVDTGPVMDKAWAVESGIGWMGKHSNIINRNYGSWIFIANIITNYEFDYDNKIPDFCGSCTACIDACPTQAIVSDYVVDSKRCISYLTIENKGHIPDEFKFQFESWLFGCDICQDVCPWNIKFSQLTRVEEFNPGKENMEIDLEEISKMSNKDFRNRFANSPVLRTKLEGLKRNARYLSDQ
jgi:epoxyqueuosine reductase